MNYLLFNNEVLISDGKTVRALDKGVDVQEMLGDVDHAALCVVDVDVLIAAAVEQPVEKKDSILVRKFKELYQFEEYVIQDEKIDTNLFQVIGIKEQKVREVYSCISPQKVGSFIPYGVALRTTLINKGIDLDRTVVFVDDLKTERLLTVFDGLKFSRTRVIPKNSEDILPEIKRSHIDYFKKIEEFLDQKKPDFTVITNDQTLFSRISNNTENLSVEYLGIPYPALEGLKTTGSSINYRLPQESIQKRRAMELKKKIRIFALSLSIAAAGLIFYLFNKMQYETLKDEYRSALLDQGRLEGRLDILDKNIYRDDLKQQKYLNYGVSYLSMLEIIPASYTVNSFKFTKTDKWNIEMNLFAENEGVFDPIPRIKILKNAQVKDIFANNVPGKHLKISL